MWDIVYILIIFIIYSKKCEFEIWKKLFDEIIDSKDDLILCLQEITFYDQLLDYLNEKGFDCTNHVKNISFW